MVGVPSSRGCDSCRKQKKKCFVESRAPPCARCERLGIECIGYGGQRLKFQDESAKFALARRPFHDDRGSSSNSAPNKTKDQANSRLGLPSFGQMVSSSATSILATSFIQGIDADADISVQLPWNFGFFLNEIPKRLGSNRALDKAASALVCAYNRIRLPYGSTSLQSCLSRYTAAISALRTCLSDPHQAVQAETLCAINLLIIFEAFFSSNTYNIMQHAGGAARIFKLRGFRRTSDEFEFMLLLSLRGPVIFQCLICDSHDFTRSDWDQLINLNKACKSVEEETFRCTARYVQAFQQARQDFSTPLNNNVPSAANIARLSALFRDLTKIRQKMLPVLQVMRKRFTAADQHIDLSAPDGSTANVPKGPDGKPRIEGLEGLAEVLPLRLLHAHIARTLLFALSTQAFTNSLVLALRHFPAYQTATTSNTAGADRFLPSTENLCFENCQLSIEMMKIVETMDSHRPIGAMIVPHGLLAAYMGIVVPRVLHCGLSESPISKESAEVGERPDMKALLTRIRTLMLLYSLDFERDTNPEKQQEILRLDGEQYHRKSEVLELKTRYLCLLAPTFDLTYCL